MAPSATFFAAAKGMYVGLKITADEVSQSPHSLYGLARRSVFNTSFPVSFEDEESTYFIRFGTVRLDLVERVPPKRLDQLVSELTSPVGGRDAVDRANAKDLIRDSEAAFYHWIADNYCNGVEDMSPSVQGLLEQLSSVIFAYQALDKVDRRVFELYLRYTSAEFVRVLRTRDGLEGRLIGASVVHTKLGRKRKDEPITVSFINALLDNWMRQTKRTISRAESLGTPFSFFVAIMELMKDFPPDPQRCVIRSQAASALSELRGPIFEEALRSGIRSVTAK